MRKFERKKWLTEIMDEIGIDLTKDNLLIAPIGSGKTYYAINVLMGDQNKKYIYLCDNTNLKNQMLKEEKTRSTNEDSTICKFAPNILVMTYKEFGMRLLYEPDTNILKNVSLIVADEIHSCIEYSEFNQDRDLSKAIEYLLIKRPIPVIMFTATDYYLDALCKRHPALKKFNEINLLDRKDIKRYINKVKLYINNKSQIKFYLQQSMEGFEYSGMKCGIYTKQITDMLDIETQCKEIGLTPICIWSQHNKEYPLNDEQKEFLDYLINTGEIKDPYNVMIFNKSMETGVNVKDNNVDLCIVNSTNPTEQIQSRGRFRKDLNLVVVKTTKETLPPLIITLKEDELNKWHTKDELKELCDSLNIRNSRGKLIGIPSFMKILDDSYYTVTKSRKKIDGIQQMYYMINKKRGRKRINKKR